MVGVPKVRLSGAMLRHPCPWTWAYRLQLSSNLFFKSDITLFKQLRCHIFKTHCKYKFKYKFEPNGLMDTREIWFECACNNISYHVCRIWQKRPHWQQLVMLWNICSKGEWTRAPGHRFNDCDIAWSCNQSSVCSPLVDFSPGLRQAAAVLTISCIAWVHPRLAPAFHPATKQGSMEGAAPHCVQLF